MMRCSDRRLLQLVKKALYALEDPAAGFVFDDFDLRYREAERKREAERRRKHLATARGRLEAEELSLDAMPDHDAETFESWLSDGGRGTEAILDRCDEALGYYAKRKAAAIAKVRRIAPHLLTTLRLIFKNGANRHETIWLLAGHSTQAKAWHRAEVMYYRHLRALLALFEA